MSDEYADAFEELLDAQEEARGKRITVRIGTQDVDAIIEDMLTEEIHLMGGDGNSGGFRAICPVARFNNKSPKRMTPIVLDGYDPLFILAVKLRNGVTYEITAGDPVATDNGGEY